MSDVSQMADPDQGSIWALKTTFKAIPILLLTLLFTYNHAELYASTKIVFNSIFMKFIGQGQTLVEFWRQKNISAFWSLLGS